jgi:hypothetical protein
METDSNFRMHAFCAFTGVVGEIGCLSPSFRTLL